MYKMNVYSGISFQFA